MTQISLAQANTIIEATLAKAAELKLNPLCVVVVDAGGHTISAQRQDGSPFMRIEIARGKAFGAAATGADTRKLNQAAIERPHFVNAFVALTGGNMIPVPGGVAIKTKEGELVGAVGVSGDTSDNDELVAKVGIEAAGFVSDNA